MNKQRRKDIAKALELIDDAKSLLEAARDEEQEYYDNMPESLQGSERGEAASAWCDALDNAVGSLDEVVSDLEGQE